MAPRIGLSLEEKEFQADHVWPHIHHVQLFLMRIIEEIHVRMFNHDLSKLSRPEVKTFTEYANQLSELEEGTFAYKRVLKAMNEALNMHYANNRHHPEHHKNGVDDMSLIDLIEMVCDWKAVSLSGEMSMEQFLEDAKERFGLSEQTYNVLYNTIEQFFGAKS